MPWKEMQLFFSGLNNVTRLFFPRGTVLSSWFGKLIICCRHEPASFTLFVKSDNSTGRSRPWDKEGGGGGGGGRSFRPFDKGGAPSPQFRPKLRGGIAPGKNVASHAGLFRGARISSGGTKHELPLKRLRGRLGKTGRKKIIVAYLTYFRVISWNVLLLFFLNSIVGLMVTMKYSEALWEQ